MSESIEIDRQINENAWDDFDSHNPVTDKYGNRIDLMDDKTPEGKALIHKLIAEKRLWSIVDGDNGFTEPIRGWHFVNRLAYHECEIPYTEKEESND